VELVWETVPRGSSSAPSTALAAGGIPYQVQTGCTDGMMHRIHRRQCPHYLSNSVELAAIATTRPGLRSDSAGSEVYRMPRLKTVFGEQAFSHTGPAVWNSLPASIPSRPQQMLHPSVGS